MGDESWWETLSLKRSDVAMATGLVLFSETLDWIEGQPLIEENKNAASRRAFSLPPYVMEGVRRHLEEIDQKAARTPGWVNYGLLFPGEKGQPLRGSTVYRRFQAICAAKDLPILRWHDFRHSAASLMLALGIPLLTIQRLLGWSSLMMLSTKYGHIIPEFAAEEIAELQAALVEFDRAGDAVTQVPMST
jgi:integrase